MIWITIFLPEPRGLPLEEIEALFGNEGDIIVFTTPGHHQTQAGAEEGKGFSEHVET